jgi:hypothetical protein
LGTTEFYGKNLNLYHKWFSPTEKNQRIYPNARAFVNVVQHLRDFERFEMNKRDLGRQREGRILVQKKFLIKSKSITSSSHFSINMWVGIVENHLIGSYILPRRLNGDGYLQFLNEV